MSYTREDVFLSDFDLTCTTTKGASNTAATHFGLDYITAPRSTVEQVYLLPGVAEALLAALDSGRTVMIATGQPMKQVVKQFLIYSLGEQNAQKIKIVNAQPKKLIYKMKFRSPKDLITLATDKKLKAVIKNLIVTFIPLHTKDIKDVIAKFETYLNNEVAKFVTENQNLSPENVKANWSTFLENSNNELTELCNKQGVADVWEAAYAKDTWTADDVAPLKKQMEDLGLQNIGVEESKKEDFIWPELKSLFADSASNQRSIIYMDDDTERLDGFRNMLPQEFSNTKVTTVTAKRDDNSHLIRVFAELGRIEGKINFDNVKELPAADAKWLVEGLKLNTRLKKFTAKRPGAYPFFVSPESVKTLQQTIVNFGDDRYMVIGDVSKHIDLALHSKVKSQTIIKLAENGLSFETEKNGLVKIHWCIDNFNDVEVKEKQFKEFEARVKQEAELFAKYNDLNSQDVCLKKSTVQKGLRVYMTMPSLGVALSNQKLHDALSGATRLKIFSDVLKKLAHIHADGDGHFDLTLYNLLYDHETKKVSICDFGLARTLGTLPLECMHEINHLIHPPAFDGAPDVASHFSQAYDIFSLGVSMAVFLGFEQQEQNIIAKYPFAVRFCNPDIVSENVLPETEADAGSYAETSDTAELNNTYHSADQLFKFDDSPQANLLREMLDPDPRKRPSAAQCIARLEAMGIGVEAKAEFVRSAANYKL